MALYMVERDLHDISPEQLRLHQGDIASACIQLKARGNRIRYISSAVAPADGRAFDLLGAAGAELVKEVHAIAGVHYLRIVEILDLTPSFIQRDTSRPRRSLERAGGGADNAGKAKGATHTMTANSELARWLSEGQRLFGVCLEMLENVGHLRSENDMLREEVARLRHRAELLQTDRAEMVAAFNDLAGHVTQVVDHILQKSEDGENGRETG
jgi:hypothetical protein